MDLNTGLPASRIAPEFRAGKQFHIAIMAPSKSRQPAISGSRQQAPLIAALDEDEIYDTANTTGPKLRKTTDRSRWRMRDVKGVQTWQYLEDDEAAKKWPQSIADKWYLGLPTVKETSKGPKTVY